jgi:ABC-type Zn uptake system ZnuABC Zn-binding protein ZnuA
MRAFFWKPLILSIIALAALGSACADNSNDGGDGDLRIVTSLPLFADIVANVAGSGVQVDSLLPSGADPHTYEPSPGDVRKVAEADVVFANGLNLEPSALRVIAANLDADAVLVELGEAAREAGTEVIPSEDDSAGNPHLWLDPAIGKEYARIIRDTLIEADPEGRVIYEQNYTDYATTLDGTAGYLAETVSAVPTQHHKIVSTHDAFDYLARAIDFEVAGFVVPSPGQESSPGEVADILDTIEDFGIPAVFSEPQTDAEAQTLEQIASDAGVQVCTLYSDAFDDTVRTYVDLLRFDADELARCLGGAGG